LSGTEIITPGVSEITHDLKQLQKITTDLNVKIVSANLPDLTPYVMLKKNRGRMNVLVTSVIDPALIPEDKASLQKTVHDPVSALRHIQQQTPHDLFVVIIHGDQEMMSSVITQCPGIDLVIDGTTTSEIIPGQPRNGSPPVVANNNVGMYMAYIDYAGNDEDLLTFSDPVRIRATVGEVVEDPRIVSLIQEYNKKRKKLLRQHAEKVRGSKIELKAHTHYVGSQSCQLCHPENNDCWASTRHAEALDSLSAMSRQNDPNCFYCHVTGVEKKSSHKMLWTKGNHLMPGVQCEACHGPGRGHSENPQSVNMLSVSKNTCTRCHTEFKDPGFDFHQDLNKLNCSLCQEQPRCKTN